MNESLERALNEVSLLKKTLSSEKTSHQNTLQQLQTTYQIIEQMKEMLKNQQDKNKSLAREIRQKTNKIQELSHQYEDQILNIKQLIERKDLQIKKYTQIKVTDYDMIRFRVISEVQAQHNQELELLNKEMKKYQFMNNENMYEIKVLQDKNMQLEKEIEEINSNFRLREQQLSSTQTKQLNKLYTMLQQQRQSKKHLQKQFQKSSQQHKKTISKYHRQLQIVQLQLLSMQQQGKQNISINRHSNLNNNNNFSGSSDLLQLKQSQFAVENEKLKHQLKQKNDEVYQLGKRYKAEVKELKKRVDELEKQVGEKQFDIKQLKQEIKSVRLLVEQQTTHKVKLQYERKHQQLKQSHMFEIQTKEKQIKQLKRDLNVMKNSLQSSESKLGGEFVQRELQQERQLNINLQKELDQMKSRLKKMTMEMVQLKSKVKNEEQLQNRQTRTQSVYDVKEKLQAANAQIVTLLKDKIALNDTIAKMKLSNG